MPDALHFVLKTPEPLIWQHTFKKPELEQILANVKKYPLPKGEVRSDGTAKPVDGQECPICYRDCGDGEVTVCCPSCGNNVHRVCYNQWVKAVGG